MAEKEDKKDREEEEGGSKPSISFNPIMLIGIIAAMLVLALIAFIIVFKVLTAEPKKEVKEDKATKDVYFGKMFTFDEPIIVNLAETQGQRYLKVSVQFEVSNEKVLDELSVRTPQMLDLMISVLSSKTIDDVANTVGRNRLRRELIDRVNSELIAGKIINVYFTEFVIQ